MKYSCCVSVHEHVSCASISIPKKNIEIKNDKKFK